MGALSFNIDSVKEAPEGSDPKSLVAQWYGALMVISSAYNVISIVLCVILLLYFEPLSDEATLRFHKEMPYVLGRPVCFMVLGLFTFFTGLLLNLLNLYGASAFAYSVGLLVAMVIYLALEWKWIGGWQNKIDRASTPVASMQ